MIATVFLFPSVKRRGAIRRWGKELYWQSDSARTNILNNRLRATEKARRKLGIDEAAIRADVQALGLAVRHEIARLEAVNGRLEA
jgi:hypothetical protein